MTIASDRYKDLGFNLTKSISNDFTVLSTVDTIKQSIINLLMTRLTYGTKFEKPELGSNISNLLSARANKFVALQIKDQIEFTIDNYEPRIKITSISVKLNEANSSFEITMYYTIISLSLNDTLSLDLNIIT